MAGKGDKRRPRKVDEKTFEDNWNRIFKKKKEVTLPTYDNKPNENMFDDLNLKNKTLTKNVPPDILE